MTVPVSSRRAGPLACNGVETDFDFAFKVFTTADVAVILTDSDGVEATLVLDSDYTVVLNGDQESNPGGTITTIGGSSPYATGNTITMIGALTYKQSTAITNLGGFLPSVIMGALDYLAILIQQLKELTDRSLRLPASASGASTELPVPEASTFIGWNSLGTALQNYAGVASAAVSTAMEAFVASVSKAAARTELGVYSTVEVDAAVCPVADTTAIVKGSADATKLLRFEVDGFTTGNTRVVTFPDANLTVNAIGAAAGNASDTAAGVIEIADVSEMEAASSTVLAVTPGRQHRHPSAAKAFVQAGNSGNIRGDSYNVSSVTDSSVGQAQINWTTPFSGSTYPVIVGGYSGVSTNIFAHLNSTSGQSTTSCHVCGVNGSTAATADLDVGYNVVAFGDQS